MRINVKRGFNHLYIVLAALWAAYWLFAYPEMRSLEITSKWMEDQKGCYVDWGSVIPKAEIQFRMDESERCFESLRRNYRTEVGRWSGKAFYLGMWPLLLLVVVAFPVLLYGICRGAAAAGAWVWRGFHAQPHP